MVCLGVSCFIFYRPEKFQSAGMNGWQTLVTIVLLALCYGFGIIIHQLADSFFSRWENRIKRNLAIGLSLPTGKPRLELTDQHLALQIEAARTRMRIFRVVATNGSIATIFALALIIVQWPTLRASERWILLCFALIVGVIITGVAALKWQSFTRNYFAMVQKMA
jgi:hypothetical protein